MTYHLHKQDGKAQHNPKKDNDTPKEASQGSRNTLYHQSQLRKKVHHPNHPGNFSQSLQHSHYAGKAWIDDTCSTACGQDFEQPDENKHKVKHIPAHVRTPKKLQAEHKEFQDQLSEVYPNECALNRLHCLSSHVSFLLHLPICFENCVTEVQQYRKHDRHFKTLQSTWISRPCQACL